MRRAEVTAGSSKEELPVLLITTAIRAAKKSAVRVRDEAERRALVFEGLGHWIEITPHLRIVVCDGSGIDLSADIKQRWPDASVEVLHFQNNERKVSALGKGYGEGQIIRHALRKSRFLRAAQVFMKCTGKLWVENFTEVLDGLESPNAFMVRRRPDANGVTKPFWVDTRFFVVEKRFFRRHLGSAYRDVNRHEGRYIEHVYCERLVQLRDFRSLRFGVRPSVRGMSGSTGKRYGEATA